MNRTYSALIFVTVGLLTGCSSSDDSDSPNESDPLTLEPNNGNVRPSRVDTVYDNGDTLSISTVYDATGLMISQEYVDNGVDVLISSFSYNASRQILTREDDDDADGTIQRVYRYSYSPTDQMATRGRDSDGDGNNDVERIYSFNDDDLATSYDDTQLNADDVVETTSNVKFEYDQGRVAAYEIDNAPLGSVDIRHEFQYNVDGTVNTVTINSFDGGRSGVATWNYEDGICNKNWFNSTFTYFCLP